MNRSSPSSLANKPNNTATPIFPFLKKAASTSQRWLPRLRPHRRLDSVTHDPPPSGRTKETGPTKPSMQPVKHSSPPQASPVMRAKVVSIQPASTVMHSPNCVASMAVAIAEPLYRDLRIPSLTGDCTDARGEERNNVTFCTPDEQEGPPTTSVRRKAPMDFVTIELAAQDEVESILQDDFLDEVLRPMEEVTVVFDAAIDFVDSDLEDEDFNDDESTEASSYSEYTIEEEENDDDASYDIFADFQGKDGTNYDDHYSFVLSDYSHQSIPNTL